MNLQDIHKKLDLMEAHADSIKSLLAETRQLLEPVKNPKRKKKGFTDEQLAAINADARRVFQRRIERMRAKAGAKAQKDK